MSTKPLTGPVALSAATSTVLLMGSADENGQVECVMRSPCPDCGCLDGYIVTRGGQDTVRCSSCQRYCYNAPKSETGRKPRSLRTRPDVTPSQRARILTRDNATCFLCHRGGVDLDVGHLVSVREGKQYGLSDEEINDDANLVAMCQACNSGLSSDSLPPRLIVTALVAEIRRGKLSVTKQFGGSPNC